MIIFLQMPFGDEYDDDDDSEGEEESEAPESPGAMPPSAAPQPVDFAYAASEEDSDEESDEEESDGEVDFLAGVRQFDPEAVRQKEREYDANMAERLAEEIPAGSSAATAGGGSGFTSPAVGVSREEYQRAIREVRKNSERSKPAKASDSMAVNPTKDSSSDSGGNLDDDDDER